MNNWLWGRSSSSSGNGEQTDPMPRSFFQYVHERMAYTNNSVYRIDILLYLIILFVTFWVLRLVLEASFMVNRRTETLMFGIAVFVAFLMAYLLFVAKKSYWVFDTTFMMVLVFALAYYFMTTMRLPYIVLMNGYLWSLLRTVFLVMVLIVALATVYSLVKAKVDMLRHGSYFWTLVFYLPCLLNDVVKSTMQEFSLAPRPVWVYLALEILFVALYCWRNTIAGLLLGYVDDTKLGIVGGGILGGGGGGGGGGRRSNVLVTSTKPLFVDSHQVLATYSTLFMASEAAAAAAATTGDDDDAAAAQEFELQTAIPQDQSHQYFSLSVWLYANHIDSVVTTKEIEILQYGAGGGGGGRSHPRLCFVQRNEFGVPEFRVYYQSGSTTSFVAFDMSFQTWHYLVFTYAENERFDLFLDGDLVQSVPVDASVGSNAQDISAAAATAATTATTSTGAADARQISDDFVSIGDPALRVPLPTRSWAVRDVVYAYVPLTAGEVAGIYNFKKNVLGR